jgi:hypothetical protein
VINQKIETINEVIRDDLPKMVRILEKVKIPHDKTNNVVYTIQSGFLDWTSENNILNITAAVKGIYRLTLVSSTQFNISSRSSSGINNVISTIIDKDKTERFTITSTDNNLARASVTWYVEFVVDLD